MSVVVIQIVFWKT